MTSDFDLHAARLPPGPHEHLDLTSLHVPPELIDLLVDKCGVTVVARGPAGLVTLKLPPDFDPDVVTRELRRRIKKARRAERRTRGPP